MTAIPQPLRMHPGDGTSPATSSTTPFPGEVDLARASSLSQEEAQLVAAVQRGEPNAFATLVQTHHRLVFGFLRARLLEWADAEDLCQEVFLRCYQGREKLERATTIASWLVGISRNLLREYVRRQSRRREVAWTELCLEIDRLTESRSGGFDEAVAYLPACMESLGPSAREAIDLYYRDHRKMAQIGVKLKRSEGAVKLLIHRARLALKNCLERKLKKHV